MMSEKKRLGGRLVALYLLIWYLSVQLHEAGHYGVAKLLGLGFCLGFNRWSIVGPGSDWQKLATAAAGPLVTLALAAIGLLLVYRRPGKIESRIGILLITGNSVTALLNHLLYFVSGSQGDERWIAHYLEAPEALVRAPFVVFYIAALFLGFKAGEAGLRKPKWIGILFLLPMALSGAVAGLDVLAWDEMKQGGFLFQPVGGILAIVLIVNVLAVLALLYTLYKVKEASAITNRQAEQT